MSEEQDNRNRLVAGTFQIQVQLSNARTLGVTGHLYDDDSPAQINKRIDVAQDALNRQIVRSDLHDNVLRRENMIRQFEQHRDQLAELEAKNGEGEGKRSRLPSQQLEILKRGEESLRAAKKNIATTEAMIVELTEKLRKLDAS